MKIFETVADLILSKLKDGQVVETKGYYASGDGGGARYLIKTLAAFGGTPDGYGDHSLANTNVAVLQGTKWFNARRYGVKADGAVNDTDALAALGAAVTAADGGSVKLPGGTVLCGKQTLAGATGLGYAYSPADLLKITDCTLPVTIEGNGTKFKLADGMKFGAFDPVTGLAYASTPPFSNADYQASTHWGFMWLQNNASVIVRNVDLDGNLQGYDVGGQYGDTGYQVGSHGMYCQENLQLKLENVRSYCNGTDGFVIAQKTGGVVEGDEKRPNTLINCNSKGNGRQGISVGASMGLTALNCSFNETGRTVNTGTGSVVVSAPAAGLDIEAESGSVNRDMLFMNCDFIDNYGSQMVADSGDSSRITFTRSKFIAGAQDTAIWPKMPNISFYDCDIRGSVVNCYSSENLAEATRFVGCEFSDEDYGTVSMFQSPAVGTNMFTTSYLLPVVMEDCHVKCTKVRPGRFDHMRLSRVVMDLSFPGTAAVADKDFVVYFNYTGLSEVAINTAINTTPPANGYYVYLANLLYTEKLNTLANTGTGITRWATWSTGGGGFEGELGNYGFQTNAKRGQNSLSLFPNIWGTQYYGTVEVYCDDAAPVSGTYKRGDFFLNSKPSVDANSMLLLGWSCSAAGTPGTWNPCYVSTVSPAV